MPIRINQLPIFATLWQHWWQGVFFKLYCVKFSRNANYATTKKGKKKCIQLWNLFPFRNFWQKLNTIKLFQLKGKFHAWMLTLKRQGFIRNFQIFLKSQFCGHSDMLYSMTTRVNASLNWVIQTNLHLISKLAKMFSN